jgi:hypothetical protein
LQGPVAQQTEDQHGGEAVTGPDRIDHVHVAAGPNGLFFAIGAEREGAFSAEGDIGPVQAVALDEGGGAGLRVVAGGCKLGEFVCV